MANILPFRGIFYNREKIKELSWVLAPPYDIISSEAQERYYEMSPYNVIRLILEKKFPGDNEANNRYNRSAQFFQEWLEEEILIRDDSPAIYLLEQEYELRSDMFGEVAPGGKGKIIKRRGFIALTRLEDFSKGIVRPHEGTMAEPKRDRLNLLRVCRANFSQVFTTYEDAENRIDKLWKEKRNENPSINVINEENVRHRLWRIDEEKSVNLMVEGMRDKKLFIADGHHRYESALEYRNELRENNPRHSAQESYNYVMSYFVNMKNGGLDILPIHRAIRSFAGFDGKRLIAEAGKYFDIKKFNNLKELLGQLENEKAKHRTGMYMGENEFYLLSLKDERITKGLIKGRADIFCELDVVILHTLIIERVLKISPESQQSITYSEKINEAVSKVRDGSHCVAFFLRPVKVSEFKAVVEAGEIMPKKSTFFYPKLLSGLVINKID
ncbi:MAG TPA: DUF1015 domain-containing protein [bacterium]|nr:DUF1015 domain-containing protein [bacterium]